MFTHVNVISIKGMLYLELTHKVIMCTERITNKRVIRIVQLGTLYRHT